MALKVLVVGAGIAGPALAFFLARLGHTVTVVERYPILRTAGAQIDLRAQGLQVARRMGLIDEIRKRVVDEDGIALVDADGNKKAIFSANKSGKGAQSFSSEFEIMRGDLVDVFYHATKNDVEYVFGKSVDRFEQDDKSVTVHFSDASTAVYDLVVGADGQGSRIRRAITPPDVDPIKHLGIYIAHWRFPMDESEEKFGLACHRPGAKLIFTRKHQPNEGSAAFQIRDENEALRSITRAPVEQQKEFWANMFKNEGWCTKRLIDAMETSKYFYCQEICQVRTDTWFKNRVVLLGDAAHCPSPMTGMGTTSALVGAYVLAGELSKSNDVEAALQNYENVLRPFVNDIQKISTWVFSLFMPKTQLGIRLLHMVLGFICFLRIPDLASRFSKEEKGGWVLPEYPRLNEAVKSQT